MDRSIAVVRVIAARTAFFVLVAVAATVRLLVLVATFVVFVGLLAFLVFLLVEAAGYLFEPAVRDLVGTIHDAAQDEFLHLGLMVR
jgi:hypothetical protein